MISSNSTDISSEKLCVFTISIGNCSLFNQCADTIKEYAKNIGADYYLCSKSDQRFKSFPHLNKLLIVDLLNKYDRVLYIDADIYIRPETPNLFHEFNDTEYLYIFNEGSYLQRKGSVKKMCRFFNFPINSWQNTDSKFNYYNTGVMLVSKEQRKIFEAFDLDLFIENKRIHDFFEQTYINYLIQKLKIPVKEIDYKYNHMLSYGWENKSSSYLVHYAGINRDLAIKVFNEDVSEPIQPVNYTNRTETKLFDRIKYQSKYIGKYGKRRYGLFTITEKDSTLYLSYLNEDIVYKLIYLNNNTFRTNELDIILEFVQNSRNQLRGFYLIHNRKYYVKKTNSLMFLSFLMFIKIFQVRQMVN